MNIKTIHSLDGRIRYATPYKFTKAESNCLKTRLERFPGVRKAVIYPLNGSILVEYTDNICRIETFLKDMDVQGLAEGEQGSAYIGEAGEEIFDIIRDGFEKRLAKRYLLPPYIRMLYTMYGTYRMIGRAIRAYRENRKLCVEVLDASAVLSCVLAGDYNSATNIMFLLGLGEKLESAVYAKSKADLEKSLELKVNTVWIVDGDMKYENPFSEVVTGDMIEISAGNVIPVDGVVAFGEGAVNQSSFTGESIPVDKFEGSTVFAGTVVEEGTIVVETTSTFQDSRLNEIIGLIADSERAKSVKQKRAENMADRLVKYNFIGAAATYGLTRDIYKSKSFLMVDFSCALKLAIPIGVMTAMRQATEMDALVKGGKHFESMAEADTIIFDKTGTLTKAVPQVKTIVPMTDISEEEALRLAACLEEHFPHSIANAIVDYAEERGVHHKGELHSTPEYIVAHGIVAEAEGHRICIGSEHFIFEDEDAEATPEQIVRISEIKSDNSCLFMSMDGKLACVFGIHDPIREGTKEIIHRLRDLGIKKMVMLTGDSENAAKYVAEELGFDDYRSQMLPEEKAAYVKAEQEAGRKVIMIGDGINDSVALSGADVGVAMYLGADIAREIADVAINSDDLGVLADVISISKKLNERIDKNYKGIIGTNGALLVLGLFSILTNTGTAFLHNMFTIGSVIANMRPYQLDTEPVKLLPAAPEA